MSSSDEDDPYSPVIPFQDDETPSRARGLITNSKRVLSLNKDSARKRNSDMGNSSSENNDIKDIKTMLSTFCEKIEENMQNIKQLQSSHSELIRYEPSVKLAFPLI